MNKLSENEHKRRSEKMRKFAGLLKGTDLYDDKIWNEVFKRKSRTIDWFKDWGKN